MNKSCRRWNSLRFGGLKYGFPCPKVSSSLSVSSGAAGREQRWSGGAGFVTGRWAHGRVLLSSVGAETYTAKIETQISLDPWDLFLYQHEDAFLVRHGQEENSAQVCWMWSLRCSPWASLCLEFRNACDAFYTVHHKNIHYSLVMASSLTKAVQQFCLILHFSSSGINSYILWVRDLGVRFTCPCPLFK